MREFTKSEIIERSLITTYRSKIYSKFIKAVKEYNLIKENDSIACCISGGKDSFVMAKCFQELLKHSDFPFEVHYLVMNPGYNQENYEKIINNAKIMNIPIEVKDSDIFSIVTNISTGNPCYLCAKMRRGVLYKKASELGCNKIALGHHFDDVIETTMMNLFYNGSIKGMMPKVKSDNYSGMELIRPMYLVYERDIIAYKNFNSLDFLQCACKFTMDVKNKEEESKRAYIKQLLKDLDKENENLKLNIFRATSNVYLDHILNYKHNGIWYDFKDEYEDKSDE